MAPTRQRGLELQRRPALLQEGREQRARRRRFPRRRRSAQRRRPDRPQQAQRGLPHSRRAGWPQACHRLQRCRTGWRRLLPGDAEGQAALEYRQRLSAAGGGARQCPRRDHHQRAGRADHLRRQPRHGRALCHRWPGRGCARQPRGHPVRRCREFTAAAAALRRRSGRPREVTRHHASARPSRRRPQPAGPPRRGAAAVL